MRRELLLVLALVVMNTNPASAQFSLVPTEEGAACHPAVVQDDDMAADKDASWGWVEGEYLLWWMKPVCLKVPVLTSGSPTDAVPGALGQPNTNLLLGESKFEYSGASGFRPTAGFWLTSDQFLAVEVGGFWLDDVSATKSYLAAGGAPTYIPFQTPTNAQSALPFTLPGVVNGAISATGSSHLWGAESNFSTHIYATRGDWQFNTTFLAGFRYLDLFDRVNVTDAQQLAAAPTTLAQGAASFSTLNQFYGPQLGCRLEVVNGIWSLEYVTKFAAGDSHLVNNVAGLPIEGPPVLPGVLPGPYIALASNAGRTGTDHIAVVPELGVKVRCNLTDSLRLSLGYNFLYWNRVHCPGDQMDPYLNVTQLPGHGPLVGPALPAPLSVNTDYFAQGVTAGLEFNY
jgi:Putative beta barrel porin-7 (BBP7)